MACYREAPLCSPTTIGFLGERPREAPFQRPEVVPKKNKEIKKFLASSEGLLIHMNAVLCALRVLCG